MRDLVDAERLAPVNGDGTQTYDRAHILFDVRLRSAEVAHDPIAYRLEPAPYGRAPPEHRNRPRRAVLAERDVPERTATGVADSFLADIHRQAGRDVAISHPVVPRDDLSLWVVDRMGERERAVSVDHGRFSLLAK